jgi:hypothetical protein
MAADITRVLARISPVVETRYREVDTVVGLEVRPYEVRLSLLRCDECENFLEWDGTCTIHGLLDPEASDVDCD